MKNLTAFVITALLSASAFASDYTYKCQQRTDRSPIDGKLGKISVTVTHLKTLLTATEYRGEYYDSVDVVRVVVSATKNGKTSVVKSTTAIARSEDVMFNIDSNGIDFHTYFDEMEESGIALRTNDGKKVDVSLVCE